MLYDTLLTQLGKTNYEDSNVSNEKPNGEDASQNIQDRDNQITAGKPTNLQQHPYPPNLIYIVLGHEIGHWALSHVTKMMVLGQIQLFILFYLFGQFLTNVSLYRAFGFDLEAEQTQPDAGNSNLPVLIGFMLFQFVYAPIEHFMGFVMNYFTRKHEYEADAYSAFLGYGEHMKQALICLHVSNMSNTDPDPW